MSNPVCHISPRGGIDDRIANILNEGMKEPLYSKEDIGAYRGLYDEESKTPLVGFENVKESEIDESVIAEAAVKMATYINDQHKRHKQELKNSTYHVAKTFIDLYNIDGWNAGTRTDRINMIAAEFSAEVSRRLARAKKMNRDVTREMIVNGYKIDDTYYDGQFEIFEAVFDKLFSTYKNSINNVARFNSLSNEKKASMDKKVFDAFQKEIHKKEEYRKVLANWAALCTFARMQLRNIEGLKLGNTIEYAAPTTPDNYSLDDTIDESYNVEEAVREAWQTMVSQISSFGSMGTEVRRFLTTVPLQRAIKRNSDTSESEYEVVRDDLGYARTLDPLSTHQYLSDVLRGVTLESNLLKKLRTESENNDLLYSVYSALGKAVKADLSKPLGLEYGNVPRNPTLITHLLLDLNKNVVKFSALRRAKSSKNIYAPILNKRENLLQEEYLMGLETNTLGNPSESTVFYQKGERKGEINWANLAEWYAMSKFYLPSEDSDKTNSQDTDSSDDSILNGAKKQYGTGFYAKGFGTQARINYLMTASSALGIKLSADAAQRIVKDRNKLKKYTKALEDFRKQAFSTALGTRFNSFLKLVDTIERSSEREASESDITEYESRLREFEGWSKDRRDIDKNPITFRNFLNTKKEKVEALGLERIKNMLDVIASVDENYRTERRVAFYDRKGKVNSRFSDMTPSYMGDFTDKIHEFINDPVDGAENLKDYIKNKFGHNSFFYDSKNERYLNKWIQEFVDAVDSKNIDKAENFAKVFEFIEFLGSDIDKKVSLFENFTEKQHAQAMLKQFVVDRFKDPNTQYAKYPSFILGDSGVQRFFVAKRYSTDEILDGLVDVLKQERERIKYVDAANKAIKIDLANKMGFVVDTSSENLKFYDHEGKEISEAALKELGYDPHLVDNFTETTEEFTQLVFLNPDFKDGYYWKKITGKKQIPANRKEAIKLVLDAIGTDAVKSTIKEYMNDALEDFKKRLVASDVIGFDSKNNKYTVDRYFKKDVEDYYNKNVDKFIEDFFWNSKYATIQQIQLFTIDPAFYDHRFPIKDLQKRYKEIYAPGRRLSLEALDYKGRRYNTNTHESAVYFDDISASSKDFNPMFFSLMQKTFGEDSPFVNKKGGASYLKNTLTDGQGYRTLESYRAVMGMSGQWTPRMETAYDEIMKIRETAKNSGEQLTEAQLRRMSELAVIFQPIKPYMYTLEQINLGNGDFAMIPVQHKYAEIVLIPELMADGKLKEIALWMENHTDEKGNRAPIDLVASTKCVKVGNFGSVKIAGINDADVLHSSLDKAWVHKLAWEDYRIQSGVPEHLNHDQLFGTQPRKLIFDSINKNASYQNYLANIFGKTAYKGINEAGMKIALPTANGVTHVNLTGSTLIALYNNLIMGNMFDSYEDFMGQTSTNQALSDKLVQNIIANANQSEDNAFAFSLIEAASANAGEFVIPPGEAGLEHDAFGLLISLFKKMVNKQIIKGGSAVQASSMGLKGMSDSGELFEVVSPEGDNVLYDEIEMPFNISYTTTVRNNGRVTHNKVELKYEDWVNPDGTLKLSNKKVFGKDAREYLSWPVSGRNEYGRPNEVGADGYDPNGYYVPLIEKAYPGVLDIIAYRIPTEKEYSMVNGKIFRFSRPELGGILKLPSSRTTTAGFDFDIDKLYFFMREFVQQEMSRTQNRDIWEAIYKENRDNIFLPLLQQKKANEAVGEFLDTVSRLLYDIELGEEASAKKSRLFDYWKEAGLEGTPEEVFNKYLENHRDKYPFESYNPEVSPMNPVTDKKGNVITPGNSRASRNNLLIDLFRQRLMDKETLKARYTPGGFAKNSEAALAMRVLEFADKNDIRDEKTGKITLESVQKYIDRIHDDKDTAAKDPEPNYDFSDPTTILIYNQQNQIASKLIGIFANQNTNHVYSSVLHRMQLKNPIKFGNHIERGLDDFLHAPEGVDVDTNVAEYLAASVDAVKDPVLNYLNLNGITADSGAMLARLGYTPMEIGLLFRQPIIRDLCNYISNNNAGADKAIREMVKKYGGSTIADVEYNSNYATTNALIDNIVKQRDFDEAGKEQDANFKAKQLHILKLFNDILTVSGELNSFVQVTRFTAANSIGATWGDYYMKEMSVEQFLTKYSSSSKDRNIIFELFDGKSLADFGEAYANRTDLLGNNADVIQNTDGLLNMSNAEYAEKMMANPLAFEQCMWDLYRKAIKQIFSKYFPYETKLYDSVRTYLNSLSNYGILDADTINSIHRDFMVFLLSRQEGSSFDGEAINTTLPKPVTNRHYYTQIFPELLHTIKNGIGTKDPFINMLRVGYNKNSKDDENKWKITIPGIGGMHKTVSDDVTEAWANAFNSSEVIRLAPGLEMPVSKIAMDYYFYNYYKLGYNFHPTSGMSLAPTLLKLGLRINQGKDVIGYVEFIRNLIDNDGAPSPDKLRINLPDSVIAMFAKQYILNHLDNNKFVYTTRAATDSDNSKNPLIKYNKAKNSSGIWQSSFVLTETELKNDINDFILKRGEKSIQFKPVIAVETNNGTIYYMASNSGIFNQSDVDNVSIKYERVKPMGSRGERIRYFRDAEFNNYQYGALKAQETFNEIMQSEYGDITSSTFEGSSDLAPENLDNYIEFTKRITDSEWKQMTDLYNDTMRGEGFMLAGSESPYRTPWMKRGVSVDAFKHMMTEGSATSRQILMTLYNKLENGNTKDLTTIDKEGNIIEACGI